MAHTAQRTTEYANQNAHASMRPFHTHTLTLTNMAVGSACVARSAYQMSRSVELPFPTICISGRSVRPTHADATRMHAAANAWNEAATWAKVVSIGPNVRAVKVDDRVLFDPEERAEVEVRGATYALLREKDVHAVAAERLQDGRTGLYL